MKKTIGLVMAALVLASCSTDADVTYFVEQLDSADVSEYRYRVIFKPSVIVPDVDTPVGEDE